ncbi:F-box protein SKIP23-like [Chenopodium quinoa]|uniref:F-box protein SKIP23-like n=1 Tax=Chenopodium quinoa TaxID=63459 RepID=UPI000B775E4D|nr:F-box protein SKIP23-like [Chenopodium quinoa]
MKTHRRRELSWSELPPELLPAIANRLEIRTDILHFRRVCKTWRSSAPLSLLDSKPILTHLLPHKLPEDSDKNHTKVLVANTVFLIKSDAHPNLPPWLFTGEELFPGSFSVRRPLSRNIAESYELPDDFPYELDLSKFRELELGMFYNYNYLDDNTVVSDFNVPVLVPYTKMPKKPSFPDENKVVLFVNPNCETGCCSIDDCMVVELSKEVALTVKSLRNGEKRKVYFMGKRKFDDIVCFKGKIYAVDRKGRVCSMDYNSLKMSSVAEDPLCEGSGSENKKRLVVSSDDELYLVYRWSKKGKAAFKVFRLNEKEEKWDMVDGIGSYRMLFVTLDGCFFAAVKDFPGWKGNCIVFPWGSFPLYSGKMTLDSKIFMSPYLDEIFIAVYHFEGGDCKLVFDCPGYADFLWPPPSWLWTDVGLDTSGMDSEGGEQRGDKEGVKEKVEGEGQGGAEEQEDNNKLQSDSSCHIVPEPIHEEVNPPNGAQVSKGIQIDQERIVLEEFKDKKVVIQLL